MVSVSIVPAIIAFGVVQLDNPQNSPISIDLFETDPIAKSATDPDIWGKVRITNIAEVPISIKCRHDLRFHLTTFVEDSSGKCVAKRAWGDAYVDAEEKTVKIEPKGSEVKRLFLAHLADGVSLKPGIYKVYAVFRHSNQDVRSNVVTFIVPAGVAP